MDDYLKPLVEEYERLDEQLKRAEAEIAETRERRNKLRTAIRALAPEAIGEKPSVPRKHGSRPSDKKKYDPSQESIALVEGVLADVNGTTRFTATDLVNTWGQRLPTDTTVKAVLKQMHERGQLRLVRTGRGGQKTYEVIR